ncbi:hypothetical protein [Sphingobium abikonense]|uniref:hypothetical protein n=1 Tax=Sphingobium abikonense TaxID=86193 RepID=UPI003513365B
MKLLVGKIAQWLGNVVLAAIAQAAVDRLSRPRQPKPMPDPSPANEGERIVITPQGRAVVDQQGRLVGYVAEATKKTPEAPLQPS